MSYVWNSDIGDWEWQDDGGDGGGDTAVATQDYPDTSYDPAQSYNPTDFGPSPDYGSPDQSAPDYTQPDYSAGDAYQQPDYNSPYDPNAPAIDVYNGDYPDAPVIDVTNQYVPNYRGAAMSGMNAGYDAQMYGPAYGGQADTADSSPDRSFDQYLPAMVHRTGLPGEPGAQQDYGQSDVGTADQTGVGADVQMYGPAYGAQADTAAPPPAPYPDEGHTAFAPPSPSSASYPDEGHTAEGQTFEAPPDQADAQTKDLKVKYDEWVRNGGSGKWDEFRQHFSNITAGQQAPDAPPPGFPLKGQGASPGVTRATAPAASHPDVTPGSPDVVHMQPNQATPLGMLVNATPLEALAKDILYGNLHGRAPTDADLEAIIANVPGQQAAVAKVIAAGGPQAEAFLDQVARIAWYRQQNGKGPDGQLLKPEDAPQAYIDAWKGMYKSGAVAPLTQQLDRDLAAQGLVPQSVHQTLSRPVPPGGGTTLAGIGTQGKAYAVSRMAQGDSANYSDASYREWYGVACSAASFAEMMNAVDPGHKMNISQAVDALTKSGLLSKAQGLLAGSDFTTVANAMNGYYQTQSGDKSAPFDAVNLRSSQEVIDHFKNGGGAIMFTGPSTAVWGVTHIYVATGVTADGKGINVVDSSAANRTTLTWAEWQRQTAQPGAGAGVAIDKDWIAARQQPAPSNTRTASLATGGQGADDIQRNDRNLPFKALPGGSDFVKAAVPYVQAAAEASGLPPELILAIAINESANNTSRLSMEHNNYFGMKADPSWTQGGGPTVTMSTQEQRPDGSIYTEPNAKWRHYNDPTAGFMGLADFLRKNPRYASVWETDDPYEIVRRMRANNYASDLNYVSKISALIKQVQPLFGR